MKVLLLNGSPKKKSDTMRLSLSFIEGLKSACDAQVERVDVIDRNIGPCMGCFGCWQRGDGRCVFDDDMNAVLSSILESDVIIWSFPLYCYSMPSHLKAVFDRLLPLSKMTMRSEDGRVMHDCLHDMSKKSFVVISGCGFPAFERNFEPLRLQCKNCFGQDLTMLCVPEAPMLNVDEAKPLSDELLAKVTAAGAEYAKTGRLSAETIARVETPMIPGKVYMSIVNGTEQS